MAVNVHSSDMPRVGWKTLPLAALYDFKNGVNADRRAYGTGIPFINVLEPITFSHIRDRDITGRVTLSDTTISVYEVCVGDLVFNRTSEVLEEVGLAAVYIGEVRVVFGGFVIRARALGNAVDSKFAAYALRAPKVRSQIIAMGQGAVRANIGQGNLRRVLLDIPPPAQQLAIAEALSDSDALIDSLEQLLTKKRQIKRGAMQELLTGKRRLPGFKGDWETFELRQLGHCVRGVTYNPSTDLADGDGDQTVRLLRSNNVQAGEILFTGLQFVDRMRVRSDQYLQDGDLLLCMANGSRDLVGKAGRFLVKDEHRYTFGAFMGCYRPNTEMVNSEFVSFHLQTHAFRQHIDLLLAGSSINNLRPEGVLSFQVNIPKSKSEQQAIAETACDMDADIATIEVRLTKARNLRQAMAQALLTGRIRLMEPQI